MDGQQSDLFGTNDDLHFSPIKFSQFIFPNHCISRHSGDKDNHNARQSRSRTREYLKITCKTSATRIFSRLSATASNWLIATIGNLGKSELVKLMQMPVQSCTSQAMRLMCKLTPWSSAFTMFLKDPMPPPTTTWT
jgi:hypothetical protein